MSRTHNRIERLGRLILQSHEDRNQRQAESFARLIAKEPPGSRKLANLEAAQRRAEDLSPHFVTTLLLRFDDPHHYLSPFTYMGWATLDCDFSVSADGTWKAYQVLSEQAVGKLSVKELLNICDGDPVAAYALNNYPFPVQFTEESVQNLSLWLASTPVGQLLSRMARSIEYRESNGQMDVAPFPCFLNGYTSTPFDVCKEIASGHPSLEISFAAREIRDPTNYVNALARKMSKWWREINDLAANKAAL